MALAIKLLEVSPMPIGLTPGFLSRATVEERSKSSGINKRVRQATKPGNSKGP